MKTIITLAFIPIAASTLILGACLAWTTLRGTNQE